MRYNLLFTVTQTLMFFLLKLGLAKGYTEQKQCLITDKSKA